MSLHFRSTASLCLLFLAALGCRVAREAPHLRKPIPVPVGQEWVRVLLDAEAQARFPEVWIGDQRGRPVPFEVEREGLWTSCPLEVVRLSLGIDPQNRPTADFSLQPPPGWHPRMRQHLRLDLRTEGPAPWVCTVTVQRRVAPGPMVELAPEQPLHLHDLGSQGACTSLVIPWDALDYRLLLTPIQGSAPQLRAITVTATTLPLPPPVLEHLDLPVASVTRETAGEVHRFVLSQPDRIGAIQADLVPGPLPIKPRITTAQDAPASGTARGPECQMLLWHLPGTTSRCNLLAFPPRLTREIRLAIPFGARVEQVRLVPRRNILLFRAEPDRQYFLHLDPRPAGPPEHCLLPDSSQPLLRQDPIHPGPVEKDPRWISLPDLPHWQEALRSPWTWAAALLLLGVVLGGFWRRPRT